MPRSDDRHLLRFLPLVLLGLGITAILAVPASLAPGTAVAAGGSTPAAATAEHLWVGWLDGRPLERAWESGAEVFDRFPDAVLVASEERPLAGWRVEGPIAIPKEAAATLLHAKKPGAPAPLDAAALARHGVRLLWQRDRDAIVATRGVFPAEALPPGWTPKVLRREPLPRPRASAGLAPVGEPVPEKTLATEFAPVIQEMVDQVTDPAYFQWINNLSGANPVTIGGNPFTFTTRSTPTTQCDLAEQYVFEQFLAMGFTDVQYDPYTFSSTSARNVVATLPGVETPQRIVIVGGHLDSTSPQAATLAPGANDNASGTASVLALADILSEYTFRSTIRFIAFTGEEQGLYGSTHYAQAAAARGDSIIGVVICDMVAYHNLQNEVIVEGESAWLDLMRVMEDACTQFTGLGYIEELSSWGSDHVPFQDVGYPAFLAIESEYGSYPCYHQTCDTANQNQADFGAEVTRACLATAAHVAGTRGFGIAHTPLASSENVTGPYEILARISQIDPLLPDSLRLYWSMGWEYVAVPLVPTGAPEMYHAFIPGPRQSCGFAYYLTAADSTGHSATHPAGAPGTVHRFWVGPRTTMFSEGFETGAPGWTHGGTKDDWQVGTPLGLAEDPASAHTGTRVYGTDLSGLGTYLGKYENSCDTWLESPAIDCSQMAGMRLSFYRWLAIERSNGGRWDYARILVNGTKIWESPSQANMVDAAWMPLEFDIGTLADGNAAVRIRFTLKSDASVVFGGWNLDDLTLSGISTVVPTDVAAAAAPPRLALHAGVPNPFNPATALRFDLPRGGVVEVAIYDPRGRLVRTLLRGPLGAGPHAIVWDGRDEGGVARASGVYFCRLVTPDGARTRKVTLVR